MSHPATLLKRYLTELNERIVKVDEKSDGVMRTMSEAISKFDGTIRITNETVSKLDLKLDSAVQSTNEAVSKFDLKLSGNMSTMSETVHKLDEKVDANVQTTNQAIGDLYREKLSVQEFREFVNVFNRILGEGFPLPNAVVEVKSNALQNAESASSSQIVGVANSEITVETTPSKVDEVPSLTGKVTIGEMVNKHVGFPMKVFGESYYVGDGVTSIVGDVEIPPGTTVDETLVVKGSFRSRECCRLLNNVKALKNIEIGDDTTVEGNLVSGGRVVVHPNCVVKGSIESEGDIKIGENVILRENLSSRSWVVLSKSAHVFRNITAAKGVLRP